VGDDDRSDGELRRQLATLGYSQLRRSTPADAVAAVGWWNLLARLGLPLPLVVVHDLGLVLSGGRSASLPGRPGWSSTGEGTVASRACT
jgi:hypothetical protein